MNQHPSALIQSCRGLILVHHCYINSCYPSYLENLLDVLDRFYLSNPALLRTLLGADPVQQQEKP